MRWLRRILGQPAAAAAAAREPVDPEALLSGGNDCESGGDGAGAERLYRQAIEADPDYAEAHYFLARLAEWDRRIDEAIALYQKAADLHPGEASYLFALGNAFLAGRRFDEALEAFRACLALLPDCTDVRINYAAALIELGRKEEARIELEGLRPLLPDTPQLYFNLGSVYRDYARTEESIATYRRVLEITPDHPPTFSNLLLILHYSATYDARAIFEEHRRFGERFSRRYIAPQPDRTWPRRLRLGYVSPDFRNHVVMCFLKPILENHDRNRFEVFCYHTHPEKDHATEQIRRDAEHWRDCEDLTDDELAERIRADRIDILVDLAGHTAGNRLMMFAMKPAPVQATYLGYPNTTGLGAVDYHITDAFADPAESAPLNAERLIYLHPTYFCYRADPGTPGAMPLPAATAGAITFGCFNNFHKISGAFLDMVARVLTAVPGSRFMLKGKPLSVAHIAQSVRDRFLACGIEPSRLELRGWEAGFKDHLLLYNSVDIALDSYPYNGATTTCESLWMGVPVVTLAGDRHAARVGSSLLNAVGLGELVAHDVEQFVAICGRLAGDRPQLAALRRTLRQRMRDSPLMDELGFTRGLESRYLEMWENALRRGDRPATTRPTQDAEVLANARRLRNEGRLGECEAVCLEILQGRPDHLDALALLWDLGFDAGRPGLAIDRLMRAIAANSGVAAFHHMLGCALQALGKTLDAMAAFQHALQLDPRSAKTHNNVGCLLEATGNLQAAVQSYRSAIDADPGLAEALYNLGNACKQMGERKQAIQYITRALAIDPGHAEWRCNLGNLHYDELQLDEAIASFRAALELDANHERAYANLGAALVATGRIEEAGAAFRKVLELKPRNLEAEAWSLLLLHYRQAEEGAMLLDKHLAWADRHARKLLRMTAHPRRQAGAGRRLRVGYVSPDFRRHPVASFIEPVLTAHDRSAFDVFCYASGGHDDEVTRRLRGVCENWRDISRKGDEDAASRIRADGIDVLVDLAGHTGGGRLLVFGRKPAPVQITWIGYPGTTGLAAMDYRFTDSIADPVGETDRFHVEKLIRLPQGFLCYAPPAESPEIGEPRNRSGAEVTFGCFNNVAKITPEMVALWSDLLGSLPESRLVLKSHGLGAESARRALREQFQGHGIAPGRLELRAADASLDSHLARYDEVDVALDTFPYNGTTTTCEALWMGVPVVTLAGRTHASRVGASLLHRVDLDDLVATEPRGYVRIARNLAADSARRSDLRRQMRARMRASPLLDAPGFTRSLEIVYRQLWTAR